ncbi:LOW QUALITY PROTEIN: hypothetical protein CH63R_12382 [Colletotrichum higginsianum IMI 349063]|uniref:Uncharacterized protein n=1 Tax=Colletotrichum higginsianum (strain IMI 349063) TaxID=759273 RepID=A0A1B7XU10_COLHI|nr:LOW QUALITY PROTEIN: hypothetical protein CH63R_12382 [Colletotrichum higginsianum IMI 349063]OBR03255.1 LOW QUALITY PROTEIN: hypothetical protein CH63R_12382 [Colletotrichum higginsianum IMI 349063]GJD02395.1 hypothetical protein ColKHC_11220 [Colletotrichum higginsianum]
MVNATGELCRDMEKSHSVFCAITALYNPKSMLKLLFFEYFKEHVVYIFDAKHSDDLSKCIGRNEWD